MAVTQDSYSERQPIALAGQPVNEGARTDDTLTCETAAGIGFGVAVGQGSGDKGGVVGDGGGFRGISVRDITTNQNSPAADKYRQYDNMTVRSQGDIWVPVGAAVDRADDVTFDNATGVLGLGGTTIVGARWLTSAAESGLAMLRLSGEIPPASSS